MMMMAVPTRAKGLVLEQVYMSLDAAFQEVSEAVSRLSIDVVVLVVCRDITSDVGWNEEEGCRLF